MFRANTTFLTSFGPHHVFDGGDFTLPAHEKAVVADAEKAFIRLLDPAYNVEKYARYPRGRDGLYASGLARYAYGVGEDITLVTPSGDFRGRRAGGPEHEPIGHDLIVVQGEEVRLVRPPEEPV